ncbi:MAG: hypothetical protein JRD88_08975 [Deltaproteobacteria bacterium]|jgi:hypothetical protein|nr:hypothetical protein [Deltaproteobacteria bacterium]
MTAYRISEEIYVQAMAYAQRRTTKWVVAICVIIPLGLAAAHDFDKNILLSVLLVYLGLSFYFLVLAPLINKLNHQRHYRGNPQLQKTQYVLINETEVQFRSEHGHSRYQFDDLHRLDIFPELVMIYPRQSIFHVIPIDVLTDTELEILTRYRRASG